MEPFTLSSVQKTTELFMEGMKAGRQEKEIDGLYKFLFLVTSDRTIRITITIVLLFLAELSFFLISSLHLSHPLNPAITHLVLLLYCQ
jgi:hypothetical protein